MSDPQQNREDTWEMRVQQAAREVQYPPTPDIAGSVGYRLRSRGRGVWPRRLLQVAAILIVLLLAGMIAVPEIRAGVLELLRLGAVRIFRVEPTPTSPPPSAVPAGTPAPLNSVLELPGETTLENARERFRFPIKLPTYPDGIGLPNRVFLQERRYPLLTLVWTQPDAPDEVRFSLHMMSSRGFAGKYYPWVEQGTTVNGRGALWIANPHLFELHPDRGEDAPLLQRYVNMNVLLWEADDLTYRLETDLPLHEARRIAESLE